MGPACHPDQSEDDEAKGCHPCQERTECKHGCEEERPIMFPRLLVAVAFPNTIAVFTSQAVHCCRNCRQHKTAEQPAYEKTAEAQNVALSDFLRVILNFTSRNASVDRPDLLVRREESRRSQQRHRGRDDKP